RFFQIVSFARGCVGTIPGELCWNWLNRFRFLGLQRDASPPACLLLLAVHLDFTRLPRAAQAAQPQPEGRRRERTTVAILAGPGAVGIVELLAWGPGFGREAASLGVKLSQRVLGLSILGGCSRHF